MQASLTAELSVSENAVTVEPGRLDYLDGLRAIAALAVVVNHCVLPDREDGPIGTQIKNLMQALPLHDKIGHFAVNLFIVLSGFCLMLPIVCGNGTLKGGALHFFKKRAIRILPPYYFALGASLLLTATLLGTKTGTHWDICLPVTLRDIVLHLFLLQNFSIYPVAINHALWSISLEWWLYFLFPPLVLLWHRAGAICGVATAMLGTLIIASMSKYLFGTACTLQYVGLFGMGMLACTILYSRKTSLQQGGGAMTWSACFVALSLFIVAFSGIFEKILGAFLGEVVLDYVVGLWVLCLLVTLGRVDVKHPLRSILSSSPLVFVGQFSYSIYLIHAFLIQLVWQYLIAPLQVSSVKMLILLQFVGVPLIVLVSYLFYLCCERPFVTKRKVSPLAQGLALQNSLARS